MTKIVKTIDKVTNHDNMRRYVHMKLSNGGSGSGSGSGCECLSPMIIEGTVDDNKFYPNDNMPSLETATEYVRIGGLVYFRYSLGKSHIQSMATFVDGHRILTIDSLGDIVEWFEESAPVIQK